MSLWRCDRSEYLPVYRRRTCGLRPVLDSFLLLCWLKKTQKNQWTLQSSIPHHNVCFAIPDCRLSVGSAGLKSHIKHYKLLHTQFVCVERNLFTQQIHKTRNRSRGGVSHTYCSSCLLLPHHHQQRTTATGALTRNFKNLGQAVHNQAALYCVWGM